MNTTKPMFLKMIGGPFDGGVHLMTINTECVGVPTANGKYMFVYKVDGEFARYRGKEPMPDA